jgi:predicted oxidoreductase
VAATLPAIGERSATVALPEIHLTDLGTNADGITAAELTQKVLRIVEQEAAKAASSAIDEIRKSPAALNRVLGTNTSSTINQATKGLNDLLKKP